jgi:hypothetical protein|tara:strand:+ start:345 stop:455 length:111 start_codon:yes stop_codon:yes gene_type:complete
MVKKKKKKKEKKTPVQKEADRMLKMIKKETDISKYI